MKFTVSFSVEVSDRTLIFALLQLITKAILSALK